MNVNEDKPESRLANSISSMTIGVLNGANIIRVHDVEDSIKVKALLERYLVSNTICFNKEIYN